MQKVYILWHTHHDERLADGEDVKLIGVYDSETSATAALNRAKILDGFRDTIEGFEIVSYQVNEDSWKSGFVTEVHE